MRYQNRKALDKTSRQFPSLEGVVCFQFRRCGKASCHCATGQKHGPYFYRCWRVGGKLHQEYIKPTDVEAVKAACRLRCNHQSWQRQECASSRQLLQAMRQMLRDREGTV